MYKTKKNDGGLIADNICPYNYYGYCNMDNECNLIHTKPNIPTILIIKFII